MYFSYLHIKFDDKTKGNPSEFQAYFPIHLRPKLNWRLGLALFAARFRRTICAYFNQIILLAKFNISVQRSAIVSCPDFMFTCASFLTPNYILHHTPHRACCCHYNMSLLLLGLQSGPKKLH